MSSPPEKSVLRVFTLVFSKFSRARHPSCPSGLKHSLNPQVSQISFAKGGSVAPAWSHLSIEFDHETKHSKQKERFHSGLPTMPKDTLIETASHSY